MGAAVAIIIRKEREIVNTYRAAGATSPSAARDPGELSVPRRVPFRRLVTRAVLRDAGNGRYYLDEASWNALRSIRHRMAIVMLLIVVLVVGFLIVNGGIAVFHAGQRAVQ
jgi:hypothetical protein